MTRLNSVKLKSVIFSGSGTPPPPSAPMVLTADTTQTTSVALPFRGTFNISVDWGDGFVQSYTTTPVQHVYSTATTFTISITGTATGFGDLSYATDLSYLTAVVSFGGLGLTSLANAFTSSTTSNLVSVPTTLPTSVTDISNIFGGAAIFNSSNVSSWNTGNVINMAYAFSSTGLFNQPLNSWNTSSVTDMTIS